MAQIETGDGTGHIQTIESNKAARVVVLPRAVGYSVTAITGTMAASLVIDSTVFAMRLDPSATVIAHITRMVVTWSVIVASGADVTAGRRLVAFRGSGAAASGGTAIATAFEKDSTLASSEFDSANGGDMRISTTAGLTTAGITFETAGVFTLPLTSHGGASDNTIATFIGDGAQSHPIRLQAGQLLALRNPQAFEATLTWQIAVDVDWYEV